MPSLVLDETTGFGLKTIEDYARACSEAADEALEEWPVAQTTKNGEVSTGFIGDNQLRSTLWTQSFRVDSTTTADGPSQDDLLEVLDEVFAASENLTKHAPGWDNTFSGGRILKQLSDTDGLVHWKFDAAPLAGRDMLYVCHTARQPNDDKIGDDHGDRRVLFRVTYAYASVGDEWAKKNCGTDNVNNNDDADVAKRVRASNCFPSCDRVTVYESKGERTLVVDHLMTTDIGGWIRPVCFNNLFKSALIKANAHECEALREYVLSVCDNRQQQSR